MAEIMEPMNGEEQATPEEEAMLEQAISLAMGIIHGEGKAGDSIAKMVLDAQDVMQGLGIATATVVIGVEQQMQIPDDMKLALAEVVLDELVTLAIDSGAVAKDEITDEATDQIVSHAYSNYLSTKEAMGELDPEQLKTSVAEAEQTMPARQSGQQPEQPKGLLQMARGG
jgi:hypothetical protein